MAAIEDATLRKVELEAQKLGLEVERARYASEEKKEFELGKLRADLEKAQADAKKAIAEQDIRLGIEIEKVKDERKKLAAETVKVGEEVRTLRVTRRVAVFQAFSVITAFLSVAVTAGSFAFSYARDSGAKQEEEHRRHNERIQVLLDQVAKFSIDQTVAASSVSVALDQLDELTRDETRSTGGILPRIGRWLFDAGGGVVDNRNDRRRITRQLAHVVESIDLGSPRQRLLAFVITDQWDDYFEHIRETEASIRYGHVEGTVLPSILNALQDEIDRSSEVWACVHFETAGSETSPVLRCSEVNVTVSATAAAEVRHFLGLVHTYYHLASEKARWRSAFVGLLPGRNFERFLDAPM